MSTFVNRVEMTASFDKGSLYTVNLDSSKYSSSITINTSNNEQVLLKFGDRADMVAFIETLLTTAVTMDWAESYAGKYGYLSESKKNVTLAQVAGWKDVAETVSAIDAD